LTATTVVITIGSFLREALIAYRFGIGPAADALALVLYYLDFAWTVFFPNAGSLAIVPVVCDLLARGQLAEGRALVGKLFLGLGLVLGVPALVLGFRAAEVSAFLFPTWNAAGLEYTTLSLQYAGPAFVLVALSGIGASVLQGRDWVVTGTSSRLAFNAAFVALLALPAVALTTGSAMVPLVAAVPQLLIILIALRAAGLAPKLSGSVGQGLRDVGERSIPALLGFALSTFVFGTVERVLMGRLGEGALATVAYAQRTANLGATVTTAITMAAFSAMAHEAAEAKLGQQSSAALRQSLRIGLTAAWFLTGLCVVLAVPLVTVLFQRGAFAADSAAATASLLRVYAAALVPGLVVGLVVRAHYAAGQAWRGAGVFGTLALVTVVVDIVLIQSLGLMTIPVGYASGLIAGATFGVAALPTAARRACGAEVVRSGRAALASAAAAIVLYSVGLNRAALVGLADSVAWLLFGGVTFLLSFALVAWVVGDTEVRYVVGALVRRGRAARGLPRKPVRYDEAER
jgi:putative peptidoglycan lipid II flippase